MKNSLLLVLLLTITNYFYAQVQDLAKLANGSLVFSNIIYNSNNQVYGYIHIFDQGKADTDNIQMEYVLLDKNLNTITSNTFTTKKYNSFFAKYFVNCSFISDDELLLTRTYIAPGNNIINSFRTISISGKSVSPEYYYRNGNIVNIPQNISDYNEYLEKTSYMGITTADTKNNGFFIRELRYRKFGANRFIKFYNSKNELQWNYQFNPNGKRNKYKNVFILNTNQNNTYLLESENNTRHPEEYKIIALNSKNGEKKYEYLLENDQSEYNHTLNLKEINNQLVITGNYSKYQKNKNFELDKNLGFYKIVLDENGNELSKNYTQWADFKDQISIDKNGRVENNFRLQPTEFFIFKDGSICVLTEKFKPAKQGISYLVGIPIVNIIAGVATQRNEKTTDFVLFSMDRDFKPKNVNTIQKDLSKTMNYDYLFSQYLKDETAAVFFFKDYVKSEKEWILGVNTITNGELKEERIPISSKKDKYSIFPMPAKEGYVILREYNEKDKYNQLRLEKIN